MVRLLALLLALFVSSTAMAEELPPDPPQQIGRVASISGAVSYQARGDAPASELSVNFPLTGGNRIATPPRGHATIDIGAGRFYLDGDSALTVGALGPGTAAVSLEQGALILHILPGGAGQVFVVQTPRGALRADQPGYFEVEIAAESGTVVVSALEGGAQFNDTTVLPPGTRASVAPHTAPAIDAAAEDDFIRRVAAEVEASGDNQLEAPTHVSPQTTGFSELQRYGLWVATEQYGWAWEPQVSSDWAPYSKGRWVEITQLGRTWIDDAPWGFAPSHYGRWTEVNDRWVWIPGNAAPASLDAPAKVSFFGTQGRDGQSAAGWVALGPEQSVFRPAPVIVNNVRVINPPDVVNVTNVNNNTTNVTTVTKPDRRPAVVLIPSFPPDPQPTPSPGGGNPTPNLSGLGAAGAPMQGGVRFPGR